MIIVIINLVKVIREIILDFKVCVFVNLVYYKLVIKV